MHTKPTIYYDSFHESKLQFPEISINNNGEQEEDFSSLTPRLFQPTHYNDTLKENYYSTNMQSESQHSTTKNSKKIGLLQLVVTSFFCISGGAYGIEPIVASCPYPFYMLLGLLIFPLFWSLPMALVCAELSTLFPEHPDGSNVIWTQMAMGRFFAFIVGFSSSISNLIDICLYPIIFMDYILAPNFLGVPNVDPWIRILVGIAFVLLLTLINIAGSEGVSILSFIFTIIVFTPFFLIFVFGISQIKPRIWIQGWDTHPKELVTNVDWSNYLSMMIWNNVGYTNVGFLVNDVQNPKKTFSKGMVLTVLLTIFNYFAPTALAISIYTHEKWTNWDLGYFSNVANQVAGSWLVWLVTLGAAISNAGLFNASLLTASKNVAFLANNQMLPQFMGWTWKRTSSPLVAILIHCVLVCIMINLPFQVLLGIEICITGLSISLVYLSFLILRFTCPKVERPFRVPLNRWLCIPISIVPIAICIWNVIVAGWQVQVAGFVVVTLSAFLYPICCYRDTVRLVRMIKEQCHKRNRK